MVENLRKISFLFFVGLLSFQPLCGVQDIQNLEEWERLLHFSDNKSRIVSDSFFLHENGINDPISELHKTVDLLNSKDGEIISANYPARYLWLQENGYSVPAFDLESFSELNDYVKSFQKGSLYLVFASERTDSPASSFGHLLLVFSDDDSPLLAADTIHFAAETEIVGDNLFMYAFNGLTGNYDGYFFRTPLFIIRNIYNLDEQRDLCFYKLDLSCERIKFLIYHLYELRKAKYNYYFLTENCAYQIASLLEITYGFSVNNYSYSFPVVPKDVLNAYQSNISEQFVLQATLKRAQVLFDEMSRYEEREYKDVERGDVKVSDDLSNKVKEVLAIEAEYQFRCFGNVSEDYNKTIRLHFPHTFSDFTVLSPSSSSGKHLFGLGAYRDKNHEGLLLEYQLIGSDIYEFQQNKMQESDLAFLNVKLKLKDYKKVYFQQLDLLRTKSVFNRGRLASATAWSVCLGINRQNISNRPVCDFSVAFGKGYGFSKIGLCCLAGMGFQNAAHEGKIYLKPSIDLLCYPTRTTKAGISALKKYGLNGTYSEVRIFASQSLNSCSLIAEYSLSNSIRGNSFSLSLRV